MAVVSIIKYNDYKYCKEAIIFLLEQIDCIKIFNKKKVFLKINLMSAGNPDRALNTNPEFIRAVIKIVKKGGGIPSVGDSSGILGFTKEAFKISGIEKICKEENCEIINLDAETHKKIRINGNILKEIFLPDKIFHFDVLVTLPKLKVHTLIGFSGAVKNQMGLLPGATKCSIHRIASTSEKLSNAIIDINLFLKFHLGIIDGILGLEGGGTHSGKPKNAGFIAASQDLVALDTISSYIIGLNSNVPTNRTGSERGLGISDLNKIKVLGENIDSFDIKFKKPNFDFKKIPIFARIIYKMREKAIMPEIMKNRCNNDNLCKQSCPVMAIKGDKNLFIDENKCIRCFYCYENCPENAIKLKCKWYLKPLFKKRAKGFELKDMI